MAPESLYSIRMRSSKGDRHVSGAERIVSRDKIETVVAGLVPRAMGKGCAPDKTIITIESLSGLSLKRLAALELVTLRVRNVEEGRDHASRILGAVGVSEHSALSAMAQLSRGAAPSGNSMRGAMIMDAETGERLEHDRERGVRASRFDWSEEAVDETTKMLAKIGLTHFRTVEALALATKVAHGPGIVAELCWSDDPDYTAGYVASAGLGYVRFPHLKNAGDAKGGRVFFVRSKKINIDALIRYLEKEAALITAPPVCRPEISIDEYFNQTRQ